jgi:hypothetical protein
MQEDVPEYHYTVEPLGPSRLGHRWRWQLFRGDRLVAGGWHLGERRAMLALRTAAARAAHERLGLHALRPERTTADRPLRPGTTIRLMSGAVGCVLVPRETALGAAAQARAA